MGWGVKEEANRLIKKFGSNEAIELCDYFKEGQIPKVFYYWQEVKKEIKNLIKEL